MVLHLVLGSYDLGPSRRHQARLAPTDHLAARQASIHHDWVRGTIRLVLVLHHELALVELHFED